MQELLKLSYFITPIVVYGFVLYAINFDRTSTKIEKLTLVVLALIFQVLTTISLRLIDILELLKAANNG